jgi:hypothetical protein
MVFGLKEVKKAFKTTKKLTKDEKNLIKAYVTYRLNKDSTFGQTSNDINETAMLIDWRNYENIVVRIVPLMMELGCINMPLDYMMVDDYGLIMKLDTKGNEVRA